MRYIMIFLFSVFISAISQTILKSSANEEHDSVIRDYLNVKVIVAYSIFFVSTLITIYAYRYVPLSMGPILEASGYVFVSFLGFFFLKEKIGKKKIAGLCFVILGILIFCMV